VQLLHEAVAPFEQRTGRGVGQVSWLAAAEIGERQHEHIFDELCARREFVAMLALAVDPAAISGLTGPGIVCFAARLVGREAVACEEDVSALAIVADGPYCRDIPVQARRIAG
jgi:hypothetical protein